MCIVISIRPILLGYSYDKKYQVSGVSDHLDGRLMCLQLPHILGSLIILLSLKGMI